MFRFEDTDALEKNNYGFFTGEEEPEAVTDVRVHNGMVERSNIDLVQEMTTMITAQRAYQSAAEVTKIYDDVMTKATNDVGRL